VRPDAKDAIFFFLMDSRFTSEVWKEFLQLSGIRPRMSTVFHLQTDGQTEKLNQMIEAYL